MEKVFIENKEQIKRNEFISPIGCIAIEYSSYAITSVHLLKNKPVCSSLVSALILKKAIDQLNEYFSGLRKNFDLPLAPVGTDFQKRVWAELLKIPYGETCSYKDIAVKIGNPNACRAVGGANNKNPIPIFIPCHRVIGKNGSLIGYESGLDIKEYLLTLEKLNNYK